MTSYYYPFCDVNESSINILSYSDRYILKTNNGKVLDCCSLLYNSPFGNDKEILSSIHDDDIFPVHIFGNGSGIPFTNNSFTDLLKKLKKIQISEFNHENLVLCVSGSETIELILHIINFSPVNDVILCLEDSYHGISSIFKTSQKVKFNNLSPMEIVKSAIDKKGNNKNIFFIESFIGSGGGIFFSDDFLSELIHLLKINNFIVVCDEIISGFKRLTSDRFFKSGKLNNIPDFVCFSKQITNGIVPLSGIFINSYEYTLNRIPGTTSTGNIISNKIALKTLEKIENTNNINLNSDLNYLLTSLEKKYNSIKVTQCGSFGSIHFLSSNWNNSEKNVGQFVASNLPKVLVRGNKYGINICPGYYFSSDNFNFLLENLNNCFKKIGVT